AVLHVEFHPEGVSRPLAASPDYTVSDPIFENNLIDHAATMRDRFALVESDRDNKVVALANLTAENVRLQKQIEDFKNGGSGIPVWKPGSVVSASSTWIVPDGTSD